MKLKYLVLSKDPVIIKFFYEGDNGEYGEFKMELKKETYDPARPTDSIGVRGDAEIYLKDKDYAIDLISAFAKAMGINILGKKHGRS